MTRIADASLRIAGGPNLGHEDKKSASFVETILPTHIPAANKTLALISDGGAAGERITLYIDTNGYLNGEVKSGGDTTTATTATSICTNEIKRVMMSWKPGRIDIAAKDINSGLIVNATAAPPDIPDDLDRYELGAPDFIVADSKIVPYFVHSMKGLAA
jgi:hypothetical protein